MTVDYADLEVFDTSLPLNVQDSAVAPGTFVRDHSQVNAGVDTADADTLTSYTGLGARGSTLHTLRAICDHFQARPWLQLDWYSRARTARHRSLSGRPVDSGHPMALKRAGPGP